MLYTILSNSDKDELEADIIAYQAANPTTFPVGGVTWDRYFNQVMTDTAPAGGGGGGDATAANQVLEIAQMTAVVAVLGAAADAAVSTDAAGTINAHIRGLIVNILAMSAKLPASLGIKADAASLSVTLSTEQIAIQNAINTILGLTTSAAVSTDADGNINAHIRGLIVLLTAMSAKLPASLGIKADAASLSVTQSTEDRVVMAAILAGIIAATPAGENFIGSVGGKTVIVNGSVTRPADTTTYASGDVICNSTSAPVIISFSNCARVNNGSGVIQSATMTDSANETLKLDADLFLYDTTVAMDNDNAAYTPTDAEQATCIGVISFSAGSFKSCLAGAGGNGQYPDAVTKGIPFVCLGGAKTLYGVLVARNAYIPVSGEVFTFRLGILQD